MLLYSLINIYVSTHQNHGFSVATPVTHVIETSSYKISGRRIVHFQHIFEEIVSFNHKEIFNCRNEHLKIDKELRHGLESTFTIKCSCCLEIKKVFTDKNHAVMDINKAAVLGTISTGGGYAQLQECFGYCDIPVMGSHFFSKVQNELAENIHELAWEVIEVAGKQEKQKAIEKGHIDSDGVPYITVIADGAWSKRSYKVNYDAASGVVSIFLA